MKKKDIEYKGDKNIDKDSKSFEPLQFLEIYNNSLNTINNISFTSFLVKNKTTTYVNSIITKENNINNQFLSSRSFFQIPLIINFRFMDMNYIFNECNSLKLSICLPNWNCSKLVNLRFMFAGCSSLIYLPDLSEWNMNNVNNISYMLAGCSSLKAIPDLSKWNTNNVVDMSGIFGDCSLLKTLLDLSKWNTINVTTLVLYLMDVHH